MTTVVADRGIFFSKFFQGVIKRSEKIALSCRSVRRVASINIPTRSVSEGPSLAYAAGWDGKFSSCARLSAVEQ